MKRLGDQPRAPAVVVALVLFGVAFAVFGAAGAAYNGATGHEGRAVWWVLVLAAVAVAVLLPLARPAITRLVHRAIYGERAAGYQVMADFMTRMAATLEVDEVLPLLAETTARSLHSPRGDVTVWLADGRQWHQTWPPAADTDPPATSDEVSVEVHHRGDIVGELGVGAAESGLSGTDRQVLADLAAPAGIALATVRLTVELRDHAEELADLAEDLVSCQARLIEARRLEQQAILARVRAGVVPRLARTTESLLAVEDALAAGAVPGQELEEARAQAAGALDALRTVARGIFPALLAHGGLAEAVQAWGEGQVPPVAVVVDGDAGDLHAHPAEEAALYHACVSTAEGMGDVGEARTATPIRVTLVADGSSVSISMTAGSALPDVPPGTARAVADRLGALGGTLRATGDPPRTVVACVPVGTSDRGAP